jgi:hypothetical protein
LLKEVMTDWTEFSVWTWQMGSPENPGAQVYAGIV